MVDSGTAVGVETVAEMVEMGALVDAAANETVKVIM